MQQNFEIRVIDEFILLGNSVVVKCLLPSFVADFIQVISWLVIDNEESTEISSASKNIGKSHEQLIRQIPQIPPIKFSSGHRKIILFLYVYLIIRNSKKFLQFSRSY